MLIFGVGVKEFLLATLVFVCDTCGRSGVHSLIRRVRRISLFFIPVLTIGTTYLDSCGQCGRTIEVPRAQAEAAAAQAGPSLR